jgi:hypothetical protein
MHGQRHVPLTINDITKTHTVNLINPNAWRKEMKKYFYIPLFILISLSITNCQSADTTQLEATNMALINQLNTLTTQLTQQSSSAVKITQEPVINDTESIVPTQSPLASSSPLPEEGSAGIPPTLIFSGTGLITPWSNHTYYPSLVFGTANVQMTCNPNNTKGGEIWIDNESYKVNCDPKGDGWSLWKPEINVGDHYIYSLNDNDNYEFWTIGTPPFTVRNQYSSSDYMFLINNQGLYNLSANLISGIFDVYITCEGAQNFNYHITQSTTIPLVLNPANCKLIIRDSPPGTVTPGGIEVSLAAAK